MRKEQFEMSDEQSKACCSEDGSSRDGEEPKCSGNCPCEPKRCLPIAGVVLAAAFAAWLVRARRRARQNQVDGESACCRPNGWEGKECGA